MRGRSRIPDGPHERRSAVRAEHARNAETHPRESAKPASSALRRDCGPPVTREVTAHKAFLPPGKRALCAVTSRVAGGPQPRRSAERAGLADSRGCAMSFLVLLRVSGVFRADGAPPFVRAIEYPQPSAHSDPFAPTWAKGSRAQVVGSVREAPRGPPLRGALLVLFSRQGEKSTYVNLPDKPQFTCSSKAFWHPEPIQWSVGH